jgi:hypothetical protein
MADKICTSNNPSAQVFTDIQNSIGSFCLIAVDEVHRLRNYKEGWEFVRNICDSGPGIVIASATPLYNSPRVSILSIAMHLSYPFLRIFLHTERWFNILD